MEPDGYWHLQALGIGIFEACDVRMGKGQGSDVMMVYKGIFI